MPQSRFLYVGANNRTAADPEAGLWVFRLAPDTAPRLVQQVDMREASYLCVDPAARRLYAVETLIGPDGSRTGCASAWAIDAATGHLSRINRIAGSGQRGSHIAVAAAGTRLINSNYQHGTFDLFAREPDGAVGPLLDTLRPTGTGPHPRQSMPRPHMALTDPSGRWLLLIDLGRDALEIYDVSGSAFRLHHRTIGPPGEGARHGVFHPRLPLLYVVGEMACTLQVYAFDAARGQVGALLADHAMLPARPDVAATASGIDLSPDGRWLVVGNRAADGAVPPSDSLALFPVDLSTGLPGPVRLITEGVDCPRALAFDPLGGELYVANQKGHSISVYRPAGDTLDLLWQVDAWAPMTVGFLA